MRGYSVVRVCQLFLVLCVSGCCLCLFVVGCDCACFVRGYLVARVC